MCPDISAPLFGFHKADLIYLILDPDEITAVSILNPLVIRTSRFLIWSKSREKKGVEQDVMEYYEIVNRSPSSIGILP